MPMKILTTPFVHFILLELPQLFSCESHSAGRDILSVESLESALSSLTLFQWGDLPSAHRLTRKPLTKLPEEKSCFTLSFSAERVSSALPALLRF